MDYALFDYVEQSVFVLVPDAQGRPIYDHMNRFGRNRLGRSLDSIRGLSALELLDGRAAYSIYRRQCDAWAKGTSTEYGTALPLPGRTVWIETRLSAVHDDNGTLTHMVGTTLNVTPERELEHAQAMTAAAAQEMEDLVCLAAHDLRSPISNLKSLAHLLRQDFVDHGDGKIDLIDMVDGIADKALAVISEVMTQAIAKSAPVSVQNFDLGAVCDDILVMLDPLKARTVRYPRQDIQGDYIAMQIILRNLIDNAFKHAGHDRVLVDISVEQINAERMAVRVRDHGRGLGDAATIGTGAARDAASAERGFGLLGVRRLARARGGDVTLNAPTDGPGLEVCVELPGQIMRAQALSRAI